ncbi:ABC transporter ATP-binding protein [Clostridium sp. CCUG 7971]|uniref:ABC transporter ATP-binding protein n=1 Tax=Clostridium sp. CCUG 7971 TaxID=2811414 RepID=UPI001ABB7183|nr:ABC transporter ATP-binding protein [Clostridium sp. CCUG 7971]MBO3445500.1 ABC transporter ATP-binding protein [Clostridium sp. CCUG 7971]
MLKIENLSKNLGSFKLKNININLDEGFIMGIVGPNGSGKTTLMKLIMGLLDADEGNIKIFNKEIKYYPIDIKNNIGFVYDSLDFYPHLKIKDFKKIMELMYEKFDKNKFNNYLSKFNLNEKFTIKHLSKGESVKLMLANALSHDAKLLILDEPTAGLDPIIRKEILGYLQEFIEEGKTSVIISTHNTEELDKIADYITFINRGKQVFTMDKESLIEDYKIVRASREELEKLSKFIIGMKNNKYYSEALIKLDTMEAIDILKSIEIISIENSVIEDVMYYYVEGKNNA